MYSLAQLKVLARSIHTATDQVHACRRHATARESCSRSMYRECGAVRARRGVSAPRRERVAVRARRGCCRRHVFTRERAVPTVCVARARCGARARLGAMAGCLRRPLYQRKGEPRMVIGVSGPGRALPPRHRMGHAEKVCQWHIVSRGAPEEQLRESGSAKKTPFLVQGSPTRAQCGRKNSNKWPRSRCSSPVQGTRSGGRRGVRLP